MGPKCIVCVRACNVNSLIVLTAVGPGDGVCLTAVDGASMSVKPSVSELSTGVCSWGPGIDECCVWTA